MIEVPSVDSKTYERNFRKCEDHLPCYVCGNPVKNPKHKRMRIISGVYAVTEEECKAMYKKDPKGAAASDMYFYPIGPECLRKHPELKPYTEPFKEDIGMVKEVI